MENSKRPLSINEGTCEIKRARSPSPIYSESDYEGLNEEELLILRPPPIPLHRAIIIVPSSSEEDEEESAAIRQETNKVSTNVLLNAEATNEENPLETDINKVKKKRKKKRKSKSNNTANVSRDETPDAELKVPKKRRNSNASQDNSTAKPKLPHEIEDTTNTIQVSHDVTPYAELKVCKKSRTRSKKRKANASQDNSTAKPISPHEIEDTTNTIQVLRDVTPVTELNVVSPDETPDAELKVCKKKITRSKKRKANAPQDNSTAKTKSPHKIEVTTKKFVQADAKVVLAQIKVLFEIRRRAAIQEQLSDITNLDMDLFDDAPVHSIMLLEEIKLHERKSVLVTNFGGENDIIWKDTAGMLIFADSSRYFSSIVYELF